MRQEREEQKMVSVLIGISLIVLGISYIVKGIKGD